MGEIEATVERLRPAPGDVLIVRWADDVPQESAAKALQVVNSAIERSGVKGVVVVGMPARYSIEHANHADAERMLRQILAAKSQWCAHGFLTKDWLLCDDCRAARCTCQPKLTELRPIGRHRPDCPARNPPRS